MQQPENLPAICFLIKRNSSPEKRICVADHTPPIGAVVRLDHSRTVPTKPDIAMEWLISRSIQHEL
jgi:hypothetical protein